MGAAPHPDQGFQNLAVFSERNLGTKLKQRFPQTFIAIGLNFWPPKGISLASVFLHQRKLRILLVLSEAEFLPHLSLTNCSSVVSVVCVVVGASASP